MAIIVSDGLSLTRTGGLLVLLTVALPVGIDLSGLAERGAREAVWVTVGTLLFAACFWGLIAVAFLALRRRR